jgi:hypothetical protein
MATIFPSKERELLNFVREAVALQCGIGNIDWPEIEESSAGPVIEMELDGWRFRMAMVSLEQL